MSGFAADWLALREPYDANARDAGLLDRLGAWAADRGRLIVVDLGGGTGSTMRAVAPALPVPQTWHVVEIDGRLIAAGRSLAPPPGAEVVWHGADLASDLEDLIPNDADLVTGSALLDLVAADWLDRLCAIIRRRRVGLYAALTYDGRQRWRPGDAFDPDALALFDRDQRRDKGFGPALGPNAPAALRDRLEREGNWHEVAADWRLGADDRAMQQAVLEGWAEATRSLAPEAADEIDGWAAVRARYIQTGRSSLTVGHRDQLWLPEP